MAFLSSSFGQYLVQTLFHSLIIAIVVEGMISVWHICKPSLQIEFRLLALLLPVLYLPLYYLAYPSRAEPSFRQQVALIDFNEWLSLRLGGGISLWHLFVALIALTTLFFVLKEALPSIRYYFRRRLCLPLIEEGQFPKLDLVLAKLSKATGRPLPAVSLSDKDAPVVYSLGRRALVLSASTVHTLDGEELEAVIAHELAHLTKQSSGMTRLVLILRFLMFYNPVALLIFRRIISDNEKVCDDLAVSLTGKRLAVASGLLKVFRLTAASSSLAIAAGRRGRLLPRMSALEDRACKELVKERVERMLHPVKGCHVPYQNFRLAVTAALLVALLIFVV